MYYRLVSILCSTKTNARWQEVREYWCCTGHRLKSCSLLVELFGILLQNPQCGSWEERKRQVCQVQGGLSSWKDRELVLSYPKWPWIEFRLLKVGLVNSCQHEEVWLEKKDFEFSEGVLIPVCTVWGTGWSYFLGSSQSWRRRPQANTVRSVCMRRW